MDILYAPMEGMTDGILRRTHLECFGSIAEYGIPFIRLTQDMCLTGKEEREIDPGENAGVPVSPQVLTRDADQFLWAARRLRDLGYGAMDLNLGCPAPTVITRGRGSAMLRDTEALRAFLERVFSSCPIRVTVKTRIGFESPDEWPRVLDVLASFPFGRVTVHPRTAKEEYRGTPHMDAWELALERLGDRAVYNGDLRSLEQLLRFGERYPGAGGAMIGRGMMKDPSLARQARGGARADAAEMDRYLTLLYRRYRERFGETVALGRMKKMLFFLCEDLPEGKTLRKAVRKASREDRFLDALSQIPPAFERA